MKKLIFTLIALFAAVTEVAAVNPGDSCLFQVSGPEGVLRAVTTDRQGRPDRGENIAELPFGTIVPAEYTGTWQQLWKADSTAVSPEGFLGDGWSKVYNEELADPRGILGKKFSHYTYESEYPSLGDTPHTIITVMLLEDKSLPAEVGTAVLKQVSVRKANSSSPETGTTLFGGRFHPYYTEITHYKSNGKWVPMGKSVGVYPGTDPFWNTPIQFVTIEGSKFDLE